MSNQQPLLRIAIPVPLADGFDYRWPFSAPRPPVGSRVRVPFGRSERVGIVIEHPESTALPAEKLKAVSASIDTRALIDVELLETLRWAAEYYHHPIGEVLKHALPRRLRDGRSIDDPRPAVWQLTAAGRRQSIEAVAARAKQQARLLGMLGAAQALPEDRLKEAGFSKDALQRLAAKHWIEAAEAPPAALAAAARPDVDLPELTAEQRAVVRAIGSAEPGFAPFLLHGVTGSGKTEVFLRLIDAHWADERQTLLLVPEIGLTPQLVGRLRERFGDALAVLHSGLAESERFDAWRRAYRRQARLIVGTRSAVFAPLPAAGLIVVDEEHDPAYKQLQGFRYSARDLAVVRGRRLGVPVLLASATPSLESFRNARDGRYRLLAMPQRIGAAGTPRIRIIDLNKHASRHGLSTPLLGAIDEHLQRGNQVLLFLNRRGFAPVLFCPQCQQAEDCDRCDARMTVHASSGRLRCHHCGSQRPLRWSCEKCGTERVGVGAGTQRVTEELGTLYPDKRIARLDRDVTARSGALMTVLGDVESGAVDILVGTQMLTKGHDFPRVTLVGVLNADQGLFGVDYRSDERLAQTILQVAGRAGRRDRPGDVIVQTHFPEHPLLNSLLTHDYARFATLALQERADAGWPPFSFVALWRAEATHQDPVYRFLDRLQVFSRTVAGPVRVLGPAPAAMERRGGRIRAQLLLQCDRRGPLHRLVARGLAELRGWPETRRVRWAIDIDPIEL